MNETNLKPTFDIWTSMFAKNLSNHSDENFKLAQILKTPKETMVFDLREMNKGKRTDKGFTLSLPEYEWLMKALLSNDTSTHTLEHNSRVIKINKSNPDIFIQVNKADGKIQEIVLKTFELMAFLSYFTANDEEIKLKANVLSVPFNFSETSFYRVTIN